MARLNDPIVTEAVGTAVDAIMATALIVEDPAEQLTVITQTAALLLALAQRNNHPRAVRKSFEQAERMMRRAADQQSRPGDRP